MREAKQPSTYAIEVALDFSEERRARLSRGSRLLTRVALGLAAVVVVLLGATAWSVHVVALHRATPGGPIPALTQRAIQEPTETVDVAR